MTTDFGTPIPAWCEPGRVVHLLPYPEDAGTDRPVVVTVLEVYDEVVLTPHPYGYWVAGLGVGVGAYPTDLRRPERRGAYCIERLAPLPL
jgi:hypothetical protein